MLDGIKGKTIELDKSSWPEYRDADDDAIKKMWLDQVGSAVWLAETLMEMRWAMLVTEKPVYITTDNPVIVVHPDLRFRGFRNKEAMVIFPLSSTRTLVMDNRHSESNAQFYDGTQTAASQNGLLFRDSLKCMFSSRNPDLVCAEIVQNAEAMGFAQGDYDL